MKKYILITALCFINGLLLAQLPATFDLRTANFVTSVKSQQGGTSWAHATIASLESNLLISGKWLANGETGEPNLAEYHLDWWNGFNDYNNDDAPTQGGGITVHLGGNYQMAAAYFSRLEGAVREVDGQSYNVTPERYNPNFHYFYPRDIEWYEAGTSLAQIDTLKTKIMESGAISSAICYDPTFIDANFVHYQPITSNLLPNLGITIIGWDDNKVTQATQNGAWLAQNCWSNGWGNNGYFWVAYSDKWVGQEPNMGAVAFKNIEPLKYSVVYYHDYHGKQAIKTTSDSAFNAFRARENTWLKAISFYTNTDNVDFTAKIYGTFNGSLQNIKSIENGHIAHKGFHTIDLQMPVKLLNNDNFYIALALSAGGQAYDRTATIPFLLGSANQNTQVVSTANAQESFYFENNQWKDLYNYTDPSGTDRTGNFCIKGLAEATPPQNFGVIFSVKDLATGLPIANAEIQFNTQTQFTNTTGESVFLQVPTNNTISYTIPSNGIYTQYTGSILLTNNSVTENILLGLVSVDKLKNNNIKIYPNPSSSFFNICLSNFSENTPYNITDISGRITLEGILPTNKSVISTKNMKNGIYFLKIKNSVHKIIVQH